MRNLTPPVRAVLSSFQFVRKLSIDLQTLGPLIGSITVLQEIDAHMRVFSTSLKFLVSFNAGEDLLDIPVGSVVAHHTGGR